MIEQNAQVVRCDEQRMWVRLGSRSGCNACDNGHGCGAGVFAKLFQGKPVTMELERHDTNIRQGQMVTLGFPEHIYLKLIFAFYGWPLLYAIAGAAGAYRVSTWTQLGPAGVDLLTLSGGILAGWLFLRIQKSKKSMHKILKSLRTTTYAPSATPGMCGVEAKQSENF